MFGLPKWKKDWRRADWSREDLCGAREIKEKAAISRLSDDDQTGPEQQMDEQKPVMVCDISLFSSFFFFFFLMRKAGVKLGGEVHCGFLSNKKREAL